MLGFLRGVPGKLTALAAQITGLGTPAQASILSALASSCGTPAQASTALSNAVYTAARAAYLDMINQPPITNGLVCNTGYGAVLTADSSAASAVTSSVSFVDVVNYAGSGYIDYLYQKISVGTGTPSFAMDLIIDGVTVVSISSSSATNVGAIVIGSNNGTVVQHGGRIYFRTSLNIRHKLNGSSSNSTVYYKYVKTA